MKRKIVFSFFVFLLIGGIMSCDLLNGDDDNLINAEKAAAAKGQGYTGPGSGTVSGQVQTVTAAQAKSLPNHTSVKMTGSIVASLGGEKFTFRDSTGDITVDIDRKLWNLLGITAGANDQVEIRGELDIEKNGVEIDVKYISVLTVGENGSNPDPKPDPGSVSGQVQTVTAAEAKSLPKHTLVIMTGSIAVSLGYEKFTFRDSTGDITVDIDWKLWNLLGITVGVNDQVEIRGELGIERYGIEVDVKYISVLTVGEKGSNVPGSGTVSGQVQTVTAAQAKNLPKHTLVIMTGSIAASLGGEKFTFRDSTGDITIDIDWKLWNLLGITAGVNDQVEIRGELDVERYGVEIDVKYIKKL